MATQTTKRNHDIFRLVGITSQISSDTSVGIYTIHPPTSSETSKETPQLIKGINSTSEPKSPSASSLHHQDQCHQNYPSHSHTNKYNLQQKHCMKSETTTAKLCKQN
ncbi:hypothetical protein PV325_011112 [Microctonus aethiopoides]|nr:hypothetical protein PV325_011112 [Microctonus aethiopoides]